MKIEVLYFKGCPNHALALSRVRQAVRSLRQPASIVKVEVASQTEAETIGFLGSPTVRINGLDIELDARRLQTYGLGCRTYVEGDIRRGVPSIDLIRRALAEQIKPKPSSKTLLSGLMLIVLMPAGKPIFAQRPMHAASDPSARTIHVSELTQPILKEIQDIEERTVAVAKDFPADLYNSYRPKGDPDVRTAAEILLHIAEQNYSAAQLMRNKAQQEAWIASGKKRIAKDILTYVSKQDTVEKVKGSFAAVRAAIELNPDPAGSANNSETNLQLWFYVIAHSNGHFGNLVTYYRNNGLVPPSSRQ